MANSFLNIPVPASNSSGAPVDVSGMGKTKTLIVGGPFVAAVNIEYATDLAGTNFAPIATFSAPGSMTVDIAARWMRASVSGYKSGTPNADVGGAGTGASFVEITAPPVNGGVG
jgi:hypothetical protein